MRIDHVLLATRDMDAAAARLRDEHDLGSVAGGRHPGWGTGNRIVPAGDQYVEIIGIVDAEEARTSPLGRHVLTTTEHGDRFLGWCVRVDGMDELAARLGAPIVPGSRVRPDGVEVRWHLCGLPEAMADPWLPFFIAWEDMASHPSVSPVAHDSTPGGIAWVEVGGNEGRLAALLGDHRLPVRRGAEPRVTAVGIAVAGGEIVLRPS